MGSHLYILIVLAWGLLAFLAGLHFAKKERATRLANTNKRPERVQRQREVARVSELSSSALGEQWLEDGQRPDSPGRRVVRDLKTERDPSQLI